MLIYPAQLGITTVQVEECIIHAAAQHGASSRMNPPPVPMRDIGEDKPH
jgi:hypothetical protein